MRDTVEVRILPLSVSRFRDIFFFAGRLKLPCVCVCICSGVRGDALPVCFRPPWSADRRPVGVHFSFAYAGRSWCSFCLDDGCLHQALLYGEQRFQVFHRVFFVCTFKQTRQGRVR